MSSSLTRLAMQPAVRAFVCFAAGIVAGDTPATQATHAVLIGCCGALLGTMVILARPWKHAWYVLRDVLLCVTLCAAGYARMADVVQGTDVTLLDFADTREKITLRGIVRTYPMDKPGRVAFLFDVLEVRRDSGRVAQVASRAQVTVYAARTSGTVPGFRRGDTLLLRGKVLSARPARNPRGFDARTYARRLGCVVMVSCAAEDVRLAGRPGESGVMNELDAIRVSLTRGINALFPARHAPVIAGLLLGDRGMIDDEVTASMRDAGVIHVMAVSGLHVGIILSLVWYPLGRLRLAVRAPLALALLWIYTILTGLAPPVLRASIASTAVVCGAALQRSTTSLNAMAAAGLLILLADPNDLFLPGFQLSFGAAASLILFQARVQGRLERVLPFLLRLPGGATLISLFSMTAAAQAGTLPLLVLYFGQFSLVSFLANLAVVPLIFVVTACAAVALLLLPLWPAAAVIYAAAADAALALVLWTSSALASLPHAVLDLPAVPLPLLLCYLLCTTLLLGWRRRMRVRLAMAAALAATALGLFGWRTEPDARPGSLRVSFLDAGQGDAVLIETPGGKRMLIDTGPSSGGFDTGERVLLPYFRARGIGRLDALLLTHPDDDHIGGARAILRAMRIAACYISRPWPAAPLTAAVDSAIGAEHARVTVLRAGQVLWLDQETRLYVLSPPRDGPLPEGTNNISIMLLLRHGAVSFLLPGDAESEAEERAVARYGDLLRCDVLKCGHHGSATSTSIPFLDAARPRHAVISCGRLNKFKHPAPVTLRRLAEISVVVHRTDIGGAVIFESDGTQVNTYDWQRD